MPASHKTPSGKWVRAVPCGAESPFAPLRRVRKLREVFFPVLCNRPLGHSGNHSFSTTRQAGLYVWDRQGERIR